MRHAVFGVGGALVLASSLPLYAANTTRNAGEQRRR